MWDDLWVNAHLATMAPSGASGGAAYGAIEDGAIGVAAGRIAWIGARRDLPGPADTLASRVEDAGGAWITPGLVDCHTHLVWGGSRAQEYEQRLGGASYEEIARAGGGIASTVRQTRAADEAALFRRATQRLRSLLDEGVTLVEIKSGYGLDRDTELRLLRVARRLGEELPVTVATTYLGAHAVAPEWRDRADGYVDFVCDDVLPAVAAAGLADAVDAYCEGIAFSPEQVGRVFSKARALGLPVKLHADQFSDLGGAALAAAHGALSADHLEHTTEAGVIAMARSGTVAVLLPGAFYVLRETKLPPVDALRRHGVPIAIATDCNPGSSPVESLLTAAHLACTLFGMTPEEALVGVTRHGAAALGRAASHGTLEVGKCADLVLWDVDHPRDLAYRLGARPLVRAVRAAPAGP
ncbi:MAG: imidazolonepropionase [Planctomycetota bacterium]